MVEASADRLPSHPPMIEQVLAVAMVRSLAELLGLAALVGATVCRLLSYLPTIELIPPLVEERLALHSSLELVEATACHLLVYLQAIEPVLEVSMMVVAEGSLVVRSGCQC